eukprot:CAMPEP_0119050332 /NCGR_PEP_ID=MMETSP1177-20130426/69289_1 /TAXON_ID=2985 /ORGANISM="Ochromonas sp, Strain CCMP1899" /LENGTH=380 /DNA_ID=CAMNT_0007028601 /DNA_START=84 /DNA_END=1226 /DNA_ORIENTATION=-
MHCKSALNDPEFNFDCPSLYYELSVNTKSDDNDINPWFLIHHANHDFVESGIEKTEHSRSSNATSGVTKNVSSSSGPARSSKRQSTTSNGSTNTQSSTQPTNRRVSQRIDESKVEDKGLLKPKNTSSSVSNLTAKRKSTNGNNPDDVDHVNTAGGSTDMRDKLSEYRLKRQKENNSSEDLITSNIVPTTDYSRSKIVRTEMTTQGPFTSKNGSSTTITSQLAPAPAKPSTANRTITVTKNEKYSSVKSKNIMPSKPAIPNMKRPVASTSASRPAASTSTSTSASSSSSSTSTSKNNTAPNDKFPNKTKKDDNESDKSMMDLLKKHNQKFAPVPAYEPPRHSVRDVRKWEKLNGKIWSNLKPEEREIVNAEIGKMKELNQL